jgi:hypothetical protein
MIVKDFIEKEKELLPKGLISKYKSKVPDEMIDFWKMP